MYNFIMITGFRNHFFLFLTTFARWQNKGKYSNKKTINLNMEKSKRKVTLLIDFEKDNFPKTEDKRELEYSLISIIKDALNEDRLIVKEIEIKSTSEVTFETIILN